MSDTDKVCCQRVGQGREVCQAAVGAGVGNALGGAQIRPRTGMPMDAGRVPERQGLHSIRQLVKIMGVERDTLSDWK